MLNPTLSYKIKLARRFNVLNVGQLCFTLCIFTVVGFHQQFVAVIVKKDALDPQIMPAEQIPQRLHLLDLSSQPTLLQTSTQKLLHQQEFTTYTVIIDPGHGGSDPGAIGLGGLIEKELTLDMANRVKALLRQQSHINVVMTRETDRGYSRANRVNHIRKFDADLLISLHFNHLPQRELNVVESFYADKENILESWHAQQRARMSKQARQTIKTYNVTVPDLSYTRRSKMIANILQRNIFQRIAKKNPDAINAGVKKETLYTLTRSRLPATLIELTCLSNREEEKHLKSSEYRQKIAESIAEGLIEYFANLDLQAGI